MNKEVQFKKIFNLTSTVTDKFPVIGARLLNYLFAIFLGNKLLHNIISLSIEHKLKRINNFKKFLVVSDLNIGDAIITSCGASALRDIFPDAEIDFVVKSSTECFLKGMPDVSNLFPIFNGAPYPTERDYIKLKKLVISKDYDLIINYSPLISDKIFGKNTVINYSLMANELVRNETSDKQLNNICYLAENLIENIFHYKSNNVDKIVSANSKIYLSASAIEKAHNFLKQNYISLRKPIIMFNPDASARFTRIPFNMQLDLLKRLSDFHFTILLGSGHVEKYIEQKLYSELTKTNGKNITIIPASFELDAYAALIDASDVFITGDTGNLHLAAARKYLRESGKSLRNKTAVFSIFGSTPPHVYGYDSKNTEFLAANQDAPSRTFIAKNSCRNITCINKMAKTCREVLCFHHLDVDEIIYESFNYIESLRKNIDQNQMGVRSKRYSFSTAKIS